MSDGWIDPRRSPALDNPDGYFLARVLLAAEQMIRQQSSPAVQDQLRTALTNMDLVVKFDLDPAEEAWATLIVDSKTLGTVRVRT